MTGKGRSHGCSWEGIGTPTWEPGPRTGEPDTANQNMFPPQMAVLQTEILLSTRPPPPQMIPLRWSRRWRSRMWRSWAGMVAHGLRLWGQLDVVPNSLKQRLRRLMVEKLTFPSLATALVDIPAVSMPIPHSIKTWDICGVVLCDKIAHFRMTFYCPWHKVHLCNDHAV